MARSILGTLGLALTLAFALPVGYAGVVLLSDGRTTFGAVLLVVAVLMVVIERYVTTPMDVPGEIAGKVIGGAVKEPDESAAEPTDADDGARPEAGGDASAADTDDEEVLIPDAEGNQPR
jgi:hypothetical protein